MDNNVRNGVRRVAKGESVNDVLHALVSEARLGDPDELERLYGGGFDSSGKLDFSPHSDEENEVPSIVRKTLTHHGYRHERSTGDLHVYAHPQGHEVHVQPGVSSIHWSHSTNGSMTHFPHHRPQSAMDLVNHLDRFHS